MERLLLRALTPWHITPLRAGLITVCALKQLIVLETGLTLHPLVLPVPMEMEKSHRNSRKFLGLFFLWRQHLLRASIVQNCCSISSALSLPFVVISIKFPLSTFGLKASVTRVLQLLSYTLHKGNRLLGGRRNGNKSNERQRRGDS